MAQVENVQPNVPVNPSGVVDQERNRAQREKTQEKPPVSQPVEPRDQVDIRRGNQSVSVAEAVQRVEVERKQKVARETPALAAPPQHFENINLGARPSENIQPPHENVSGASAQGVAEAIKSLSERPQTVIRQRVERAADPNTPARNAEPQENIREQNKVTQNRQTQQAQNKEARQLEANQDTQGRQEQKQNVTETQQKRNPVAVQTQRGQNVNNLT